MGMRVVLERNAAPTRARHFRIGKRLISNSLPRMRVAGSCIILLKYVVILRNNTFELRNRVKERENARLCWSFLWFRKSVASTQPCREFLRVSSLLTALMESGETPGVLGQWSAQHG
jgi:hypothetical protein